MTEFILREKLWHLFSLGQRNALAEDEYPTSVDQRKSKGAIEAKQHATKIVEEIALEFRCMVKPRV